MKRALPILVFLASLVLALTGAIVMMTAGISKTGVILLAGGLATAVLIWARTGGKLGGMDEREVAAAIRERAQKNWEAEHTKQPQGKEQRT